MGIYTVLDCFSGYGGFGLGLRLRLAYPNADFKTVCYIEWDKYCQRVIQARIGDGHLDDAPIWGGDIRNFDGRPWRGRVDILSASFPCQPFSNAGKREGEFDSKGRNLWPDTLRIIREVEPRLVVLENVPGLATAPRLDIKILEVQRQLSLFDQNDNKPNTGGIHRSDLTAYGYPYMGRIVGDLSNLGLSAEWQIVSASEAGAPHLRNRWWLLAYPNADLGGRLHGESGVESAIG